LQHPSGQYVVLYASKNLHLALHNLKAKGSEGVDLVLVVCEFLDVFLEELMEMPPERDIKFVIQPEFAC
jgi:hypothetical protein